MVVLISGGARGIGRQIALDFLRQGATVVVLDREGEFPGARFVQGDVGLEQDAERAVQVCVQEFGGLDCLVNNAGRMGERTALEQTTLADWEAILRTNLTGMFLLAREAAPYLKKSRGSIINIASTRATMSEPNTFAYSASKGGVLALTHSLAASLAPVRVNSISPGWIDVEGEPLRPVDHEQHWTGRVGKPQDVSALVLFLASDAAGFITGADFVVDGGMTRRMIYAE